MLHFIPFDLVPLEFLLIYVVSRLSVIQFSKTLPFYHFKLSSPQPLPAVMGLDAMGIVAVGFYKIRYFACKVTSSSEVNTGF